MLSETFQSLLQNAKSFTFQISQNEFSQIQRDVRQEKDFPAEKEVPAGNHEILVAQAGPGQPQLGDKPAPGRQTPEGKTHGVS